MKIGIDFGSTYSTFSTVDPESGELRPLTLAEGDPNSIPSVVSIQKKNKQVSCGVNAKNKIGKKVFYNFEAFKMLLTESNPEMIRNNGYFGEYTPKNVAKIFLETCLNSILTRYEGKGSTIEDAVICVPEIWGNKANSMDGKGILLDILSKELAVPVNHVRIVTEPEAASAFFAYNYEKETGKTYNGHLLLIDYGGGTLDLTLTEISSVGDGFMEITYRESGGAGDNHPDEKGFHTIGSAGIAYMRSIAYMALRDAGMIGEDEELDFSSPQVMELVRDIESSMKDVERIHEIEDYFGFYGSYSKFADCYKEDEQDSDSEFTVLEYNDEEVRVSFQQLFRAYQATIEKVLSETVTKMNAKVYGYIGGDPCSPAAGVRDDFKIALVGGFGSCFFVKEQIASIYDIDPNHSNDLRMKSISADKREVAISYGAALLAAGKVTLQKTARFSIGLYCKNPRTFHYGIKCHQIIETDKPYFICQDDIMEDIPENRITYGAIAGNIDAFVIEFSDNLNHGGIMPLKEEMRNRLSKIPETGIWNCGFSMNENDIVSMHVVPSARFHSDNKPIVIPLERYGNLFDMNIPEEVSK